MIDGEFKDFIYRDTRFLNAYCETSFDSHQSLKSKSLNIIWTEFGYKPIYSQLGTTHYVATNKIIHVYFSHMIYLMSHVTSFNNTCKWSYKLSRSKL